MAYTAGAVFGRFNGMLSARTHFRTRATKNRCRHATGPQRGGSLRLARVEDEGPAALALGERWVPSLATELDSVLLSWGGPAAARG